MHGGSSLHSFVLLRHQPRRGGIGQQQPSARACYPWERGRETSAFEMVLAPFPEKSFGKALPSHKFKKAALCCERRPYTPTSGFTPPRSFSSLLRTGNLAAHTVYRLMLLDPSPDMVHGSALRETRSSTQEKELNSEKIHSQEGDPPLL